MRDTRSSLAPLLPGAREFSLGAPHAVARLAIAAMNGTKLDGLQLMVSEARPRREVLGCSRRAAAMIRR
jgi:hypothetical protein